MEFAGRYGVTESIIMAALYLFEQDHCPPLMHTYSAIMRLYPIYHRNTYRKAMVHLIEEGFVSYRKRQYRGRLECYICSITDKAIKEYRFGA